MIRIGVDVGDARVGVARSDADGLLATPVRTLQRQGAERELQAIIAELGAERIYVGLPKMLDGKEGTAAQKAREFIGELASLSPVPGEREYDVFLVDERMTTVIAHRALTSAGKKTKSHRAVIDQVAAVNILQGALDQERTKGTAVGEPWFPEDV